MGGNDGDEWGQPRNLSSVNKRRFVEQDEGAEINTRRTRKTWSASSSRRVYRYAGVRRKPSEGRGEHF